ncbi:PPE family protein, partial [Mycobacterium sp.]|uniref:PPE family protein n=1 Tax=Mycobacterium sp. TaxID=1785 RepID=UPI0025FDE3EE
AWMTATGAQAQEAAGQAKLAAGAYEAAFAATVPPQVVAANRALLATLVATNFLGQNTPAIAATEAHYLEMWAQDAAAMYAYAAWSAAAAQLKPFVAPPQTTAAATTPAAGMQLSRLVNAVPSALQRLANGVLESATAASGKASGNLLSGLDLPHLASSWSLPAGLQSDLTNWDSLTAALASGPYSLQGLSSIAGGPFLSFGQAYAWGQNGQGAAAYLAGPKAVSGALAPLTQGTGAIRPMLTSVVGGGPAAGTMGKAALVGSMSVPQGWTEAAPAIRTLTSQLPTDLSGATTRMAGEGAVFGQMALSSLAGRAVAGAAFQSAGGGGSAAGSLGGAVTQAGPAAATIIVIPAIEE